MSNESNFTPVEPDVAQALEFFATLYPAGGLVHFRAVPEPKDGRTPTNHHYELNEAFRETLGHFLLYCQVEKRAAFFLPGTVDYGGTGKNDVLSIPTVLVDLDKGDTEASLAAASEEFGPPTMIVESGGTTDAGTPKLHAYWVLEEPATGAAIDELCRVREALALKFDGDAAFKQPAQVPYPRLSSFQRHAQARVASVSVREPLPTFRLHTRVGQTARAGEGGRDHVR